MAFLGSVLLHLQNPFEALRSAARRTRDVLIVTEPAYPALGAQMEFVPTRLGPSDTWWRLSQGCIAQMMDVLGFDIASITHSRHTLVDEKNPRAFEFFSVVGRRGVGGQVARPRASRRPGGADDRRRADTVAPAALRPAARSCWR